MHRNKKYGIIIFSAIAIFIFLIITQCSKTKDDKLEQDDLVEYFRSYSKRWRKFDNSSLIFGDTLSHHVKQLLKIDTSISNDRMHLKSAFKVKEGFDSISYFMYGIESD